MSIWVHCEPREDVVAFENVAQNIGGGVWVQRMFNLRRLLLVVDVIIFFMDWRRVDVKCRLKEHRADVFKVRAAWPEPRGHSTSRSCWDEVPKSEWLLKKLPDLMDDNFKIFYSETCLSVHLPLRLLELWTNSSIGLLGCRSFLDFPYFCSRPLSADCPGVNLSLDLLAVFRQRLKDINQNWMNARNM